MNNETCATCQYWYRVTEIGDGVCDAPHKGRPTKWSTQTCGEHEPRKEQGAGA